MYIIQKIHYHFSFVDINEFWPNTDTRIYNVNMSSEVSTLSFTCGASITQWRSIKFSMEKIFHTTYRGRGSCVFLSKCLWPRKSPITVDRVDRSSWNSGSAKLLSSTFWAGHSADQAHRGLPLAAKLSFMSSLFLPGFHPTYRNVTNHLDQVYIKYGVEFFKLWPIISRPEGQTCTVLHQIEFRF